jgi:uncharacterized protein YndB with AHSA1/START domain
MAPITTSTEIERSADEVFAYVTDPSTMPKWQQGAVSGHMDAATTRVGSKCVTVRRIGGREREVTTEITEYDPPHRWADPRHRGSDQGHRRGHGRAARGQITVAPDDRAGLHRPRDRKAAGSAHRPSPGRQ